MTNQLPAHIQNSVNAAFISLQKESGFRLRPFYRLLIYRSIKESAGTKAHQVQFTYNLLTTQHVSNYWEVPAFMIPENDMEYDFWRRIPVSMIELAEGVFSGAVNRQVALEQANHLEEVNAFTGQPSESPYYHEWCVFLAGLSLLRESLDKADIKLSEVNNKITVDSSDENLASSESDTAKWACLAYTGGAWVPDQPANWLYDSQHNRWTTQNEHWYFEDHGTWDRDTPDAIARRHDFWVWWLTQAITEAWSQV